MNMSYSSKWSVHHFSSDRRVAAGAIDPRPVSGSQELLEEMVNRRIWQVDRDH